MTSRTRIATLALIPILALTAAGCGSSGKKAASPAPTGACKYAKSATPAARKVSLPPSTPTTKSPTEVTISTNRGDIKVSLDGDKTPCTVNSFLSLAKQGYFDNTPCHRLVTSGILVLQCGDPTGTGGGGPGYTLPDELLKSDPRLTQCNDQTCTYPAGTLAMGENGTASGQSVPNSAGSQFFLVYGASPLQPVYPVFGHMNAAGLDVVKAIAKHGATAPDPTTGNTAPKETVTITSVK